ncbi:hypothetical protein D8Y22_10385 [Salinadaptatus halalkaliphilus]|uniref:Zinc ribbon domain-containing protein n=1 Tax=Salinadaptatus halalkaliphilus TaxID=2419781 RepID=A0A4S3TPB6_9EURY|nr:hypothetical protein [Salinadaptatus halalkaliphilus]THE65005.1 hypothetical protein D8Y22_10385 [Salinadaptatus halalkaliphilus]
MKWRCTWCGKPHAENDPPCDNCGHNVFEEAIVRADEEPGETPEGTVDTGTTYVWACPNCGREHVKHNPPCSRCGNPTLEKTEQTYDDVDRDLETPSWLEVAKPYAPVIVVVAVVVGLFATGIVPPSIVPGIGPPSPPDASGDGTEAAGLDLEVTAAEIHAQLEAEREGESVSYDDGLVAYATYYNRGIVASEYDDARIEAVSVGDFDAACNDATIDGVVPIGAVDLEGYDDESALAADLAGPLLESTDDELLADHDAEGFDVHVAPDNTVFVYYAAC